MKLDFSLKILALFLLIFFSCEKDPIQPSKVVEVAPELQIYWDSFVQEAEARGVDLRIDTLNFRLDFAHLDTVGSTVAGKCYAIPGGDVLIDIDSWEDTDLATREALIFHELGHCVLGRRHTNPDVLAERNLRSFECSSYMTACLCGSACGIDYYSAMWRAYYMDELFGRSEAPTWIDNGMDYFENNLEDVAFEYTDTQSGEVLLPYQLEAGSDYQIRVDIEGHKDFRIEINDLTFDFSASNGQTGISKNDVLFFDLEYINAWMSLNTDLTNTSFTYRHLDGIDYFYLKETLLHSREGNSGLDRILLAFPDETNFSTKIAQ